MRRALVLTAVAATSHPIKPQVRDAAGDWKVASQDVLDATVTATAKQIRGDLHLSAPPAQGIPGKYDIGLYAGCTPYSLHFTWNGGLAGSTATLDRYACYTGDPVQDERNSQPIASTPATATITPTGLRIVAAPTAGLHRGVRVYAFAETWLTPVILGTPGSLDWNQPTYGGDIGFGNGAFRLGS
jgi:hypothetical protein